jgi:hypothetical protein
VRSGILKEQVNAWDVPLCADAPDISTAGHDSAKGSGIVEDGDRPAALRNQRGELKSIGS